MRRSNEDDPNPQKKLKTWQKVLLLAGGAERLMEVEEESVGGGGVGVGWVMLAERLL